MSHCSTGISQAHLAASFLKHGTTHFQNGCCVRGHPQLTTTQMEVTKHEEMHGLIATNLRCLRIKKQQHTQPSKTHTCQPQDRLEGKTITAICSYLQLVLSCLSNQMSLSARWGPNFISSLAAGEQKGSPWWFNNLALTLVKAPWKQAARRGGRCYLISSVHDVRATTEQDLGHAVWSHHNQGRMAGHRDVPRAGRHAALHCLETNSHSLLLFIAFNPVGTKDTLLN